MNMVAILYFLLFCLISPFSTIGVDVSTSKFKPEQVHLTFHSDPNKLIVSWVSFEVLPFSSIIEYGSRPHQLTNKNEGTFLLYDNDICRNSTRAIHTVEFNIKEDEQVFYRLSGDNGLTFSDIFNTTGQRRSFPHAVALFGDMGINCELSAVSSIIKDAFAGVHSYALHYGDTAYNMDEQCGQVGDNFLNAVQPYSSFLPIVYTNGNHEGGPYKRYHEYIFRLADAQNNLANTSQSFNNRYFMFSVGPVTYVAIDPDAWIYPPVFPLAQPQYDWLQKVLPTVNRTVTPWLVVLSHRAMYCTKTTDRECNQEAEILRNGLFPVTPDHQRYGLEDLFLQYGVDFVFSGHVSYVAMLLSYFSFDHITLALFFCQVVYLGNSQYC